MATYDSLLIDIGEFGRYQKLVFYLTLCLGIPAAFNTVGVVLMAATPQHWCYVPQLHSQQLNLTVEQIKHISIPRSSMQHSNSDSSYSSCTMYDYDYSNATRDELLALNTTDLSVIGCQYGWSYDQQYFDSTFVTEHDLVCDSQYLVPTLSSVFMAGLLAGVIIFGVISDIVGRKPILALTIVITTTCSIMLAFSPSYTMFTTIRFFVAFFNIAMFTTGFVMAVEYVGPSWRTFVGTVFEYTWAIGTMLLAPIGYFARDWQTFQLVTAVPIVLCFVIPYFLYESPRWLYSKNRHEKADEIVRRMARHNHVELHGKINVDKQKSEKRTYPWHLLATPRMRARTINTCYNWSVCSFVYYGLSLNTSNLGGNPYLNMFISGAVELVAYIGCQVILGRIGCKKPLIASQLLASAALLLILAVPESLLSVTITFAMIGKLFISASFTIIYVYTAEMCPTVVRNTGVSTGSFFARIGGVVAPYVGAMVNTNRVIPYLIFGISGISAGLLALLLPETFRKPLPETMQEGEDFGKVKILDALISENHQNKKSNVV